MFEKMGPERRAEVMAARTERDKAWDRAEHRAEPHFCHQEDIEKLADEILKRWMRRVERNLRAERERPFFDRLLSLQDLRT